MNWTPNGFGQGINFKLNVKSPTLRDLKIEKEEEFTLELDFKTSIVLNVKLGQIPTKNYILMICPQCHAEYLSHIIYVAIVRIHCGR